MSISIWLIEYSADQGKTWKLTSGKGYFRLEKTAQARAKKSTEWCCVSLNPSAKAFGQIFRAKEFRRVD